MAKSEASGSKGARNPGGSAQVDVADPALMVALCGPRNEHLRVLEVETGVSIGQRGHQVHIQGTSAEEVAFAERVVAELCESIRDGNEINGNDVARAVRLLKEHPELKLRDVFQDVVLVSARHRIIAPKGLAQKRYIEALRAHDIVFGIGPAGTGKTYLAMAMAVAALMQKKVKRIILTRPAVEAGEKLGFLPGDLAEKVNPYLRPLYDAMHDMMDLDKAQALIQRGQIEVAPLAFMRGRAQPYFSRVLTPKGFRPIGGLKVGDQVIGSDGQPTRVLGVFPRGVRPVFRVTTQDGASTLCCGEHLWNVYTPEDRRRNKGPRTLETQQMVGNLRRAHQHRYELPLFSEPVRFAPRDVPMDPYALGLLLGDGCITAKTTPSFASADLELVHALQNELEGIEIKAKGGVDYVLRQVGGMRGGIRVPNPVTVTMRSLGLSGTSSHTKFVPEDYLYNSAGARLALLQGLLDTDGGPVLQAGRSCRIQYTTTSPRLRDDVTFLVRSLGGVAYCRTRAAEGRKPGLARGRSVEHRADAYVMDVRLPAGMRPFRLMRKWLAYQEAGGGRPMRHIESIEPVGEQDTLCIQVAAADSLYVTDDFLLTHNTLNEAFVILDEAQNTTSEQMKMFLTRLGYDSKAVITGDVTQVDLPEGRKSGLSDATNLLAGVEGIAFCTFTDVDVVRHPLVARIVRAYEARDSALTRGRAMREENRAAVRETE